MTDRKPFEANPDNVRIISNIAAYMRNMAEDAIVPYHPTLALLAESNDMDGSNYRLQRALEILAREGLMFYNVRGMGYRRGTPLCNVDHGMGRISRARTQAKKGLRSFSAADELRLSPDDRNRKRAGEIVTACLVKDTAASNLKKEIRQQSSLDAHNADLRRWVRGGDME